MSLQKIGEFGLIDRIRPGCLIRPEGVVTPIGDDAAVFTTPERRLNLLTTDLMVERVHFLRNTISGIDLGHKSLAVNLSDIAAMGGTARDAYVSIAIPPDCSIGYVEDIYAGMRTLASEYDVNILGGDTTRSKTDLIINLAVTGLAEADALLLRSSAQPGDAVLSTGYLGDSRAGLHLILNRTKLETPGFKALLTAHLRPRPHLHQGHFLARQKGVHAAIDVSDGLSSDLNHVVTASRCGARLFADQIPLSAELREFCTRFEMDPVSFALAGGEDYTLLCTADAGTVDAIVHRFEKRFKLPLFVIGEMTGTAGIDLVTTDGESTRIDSTGWDHFKEGNQQ